MGSRGGSEAATLVDRIVDLASTNSGRPLVTFYDESSGERVELSSASAANWVTKIANLLTDDLGCEPGGGAEILLPTSWLSIPILLGCWTAGLVLASGEDAVVRFVGPPDVSAGDAEAAFAPKGSAVTVASAMRPLGGAFSEPLPTGWLDFATVVPSQPDVLVQPSGPSADDLAISLTGSRRTHAELVSAGQSAAERLGLAPGGRLATDLDPADLRALPIALAAPLVMNGSVVLVVNASPAEGQRVVAQEAVTVEHWSDDHDYVDPWLGWSP